MNVSGAALSSYQAAVFRRGSVTYFNSSLFFPPAVRRDVFALYAFVRRADDFVDAVPQDAAGFRAFRGCYRSRRDGAAAAEAAAGLSADDRAVVDDFVALAAARRFDPEWAEAFLDAMEADLTKSEYGSLEETLRYVYGSAEVIGLFMARIMDLPPEADGPARLLGRAMQYINFIRDVAEDRRLGRRYLPLDGAAREIADPAYAAAHPQEFAAWLRGHLGAYRDWQRAAAAAFPLIPYRCRVAVSTAAASYWWTARRIERNPLVVLERKVKPGKVRIVLTALLKALSGARR